MLYEYTLSPPIAQIRDCLAYYSQKVRPSSRLPVGGADHWEAQRWFALEEPKRVKAVKALERAMKVAESEGGFAR
jgi:hypothetical protein